MKSRYLKILIVVGACLLALITVQVIWMADAWKLKNNQFDKDVTTVLKNVADEFEYDLFCVELFANIEINPGEGINLMRMNWSTDSSGARNWSGQELSVPFLYKGENDTLTPFENGLKFRFPATIQLSAKT